MPSTAPFADVSDVPAAQRAQSDDATIAALLDEASQIIQEIPQVAARIAADLIAAATLRSVCVRMVVRVLLNPQGLRQFAVSVDDVARSGTYEAGGTPAGELMVSANELDRLMGRVGLSAAFTVLSPALLVPSADGFMSGLDISKLYLLDPSD